jgi:putative heme-binding domain-containing protein
LEALGIGADGDWDACLAAWLNKVGSNWKAPASRDIVWRSRAAKTPQLLAELIEDPATPAAELPRYLRAFDFLKGPEKERALVDLAFGDVHRSQGDLVAAEAIQRLDRQTVLNDPAHAAALKHVVDKSRGTRRFVDLIQRFSLSEYGEDLLALAQKNPEDDLGVQAVGALLAQHDEARLIAALSGRDPQKVADTIRVMGSAQIPHANRLLTPILNDPARPLEERREALRALCRSKTGAAKIMARAEAGKLEPELRETASAALHASTVEDIRNRADKLYPLRAAADSKPLPPMRQLAKRLGDSQKGRVVFTTNGTCVKCHIVNGEGKEVGPNLSEIGGKLSRLALYESVLFPSAAISHNFEAYTVILANGNVISGLLVNRTAESIAIKGADAITHTYRVSEVEEIKQQPISLMPADLQKGMTADDLVNVVEYLTTLKHAAPAKKVAHQ